MRYLFFLFLCLSLRGLGQTQTRYQLPFDAHWQFHSGDAAGASDPKFDGLDRDWRVVDLPHDWSIEGDFDKNAPTGGRGGYLPTGIGWYRKTFDLPKEAKGKLVSIQFDGVYQNSEVWINGHSLGKRPNGYITFVYDLTPYLKARKNVLAVRVDNSRQPNTRWYSGSGIYRHVWMIVTDAEHIAHWGTFITTASADPANANLSVQTTVAGIRGAGTLVSEVLDRDGRVAVTAQVPISGQQGDSVALRQDLSVPAPHLWSLDHPYMYTLHSIVKDGEKVVDDYRTPFGIRTIAYTDTGFVLNGQRVKMNGVCLHHDGGCVGAAVPLEIWKDRLTLLKQMGCNAIRTSHNPPAPEFLDLCDRMGFLVMDEAFDAWESGKVENDYHLYFDQWWKQDVTDQIHRDRNHPSVVLWSAGNEIPDQTKERGTELLKALLAVYHAEDPTRPVTTANDDIAADNGSTRLDFMEAEDIVGYNYADRWHERRELMYDVDRYQHPGWKVIGTEDGPVRSVLAYSLGTDPARVRPNYNTGSINAEQLWKFIAVRDWVIGDFMWTGVDYLGESFWPSKGAYSGVIDRTDVPKDGYYFYQSQWTLIPVLHVFPHWNWPGREGQVIPVMVYTNCDTVELFVNGKSYGMKTMEFPRQGTSGGWNRYARPVVPLTTADLHLSWDVTYEPGTLLVVGRKGGHEYRDSVVTTGAPAAIRIAVDSAIAHPGDAVLVHVSVVDAEGRIVPTATDSLTFELSGPARLRGTDNGDPRDDDPFRSAGRKAFKGRAYAVIQAGATPGDIHLRVDGQGLTPADVTVAVKP